MYAASKTAATGMLAAQTETDVLSHAIANARTAGYKQQNALFSTLGSVDKSRVGTLSSATGTVLPTGIQVGMGVKIAGVTSNLKQGEPINSDNPNHLMIRGNGYFQIQLPSGDIAYTRDGTFEMSPTGEIVTQDGFVVLPGITIPQNALSYTVNRDGQVSAKIAGQIQPVILGQIELASFVNPGGLEAIESNLLLESPASGAPVTGVPSANGFGGLMQRWYEGSNVNSVLVITDLIQAQHLYGMNSNVIKAVEEMAKGEASILV